MIFSIQLEDSDRTLRIVNKDRIATTQTDNRRPRCLNLLADCQSGKGSVHLFDRRDLHIEFHLLTLFGILPSLSSLETEKNFKNYRDLFDHLFISFLAYPFYQGILYAGALGLRKERQVFKL